MTYDQLAAKTRLSAATLRAAAGGTRLPTWKVTCEFVSACGGDQGAVRTLWADACRASGRPVPGEPPAAPPDPGEAASAAHLIATLKQLRLWANSPSLAELNTRAGGHNLLPPSTVSDMLRRQRLPRIELMLAFVRACELNDDQIIAWGNAWNRIKARENDPPAVAPQPAGHPAGQDPGATPASRPLGRAPSIAATLAAMLGSMAVILGGLTAGHVIHWSSAGNPQVTMPQTRAQASPVVFAVSGRQDSPRPAMTSSMQSAAATAAAEGAPIGLVDLDGRPRLTMIRVFHDPGMSPAARPDAKRSFLARIAAAVRSTRAAFPDVNVLGALDVAAQAIRARCPHGGTIYLEDSGLQDIPPVNFRQAGMLSASPADVVTSLDNARQLPRLNGMTVILVGIGDTAAPQAPLNSSQQASVTAIWTAIAKAAGATSVQVDSASRSGPAPTSVPAVAPVSVSAFTGPIPGWALSDQGFVVPDTGPLGFSPNAPQFRHPAAAMAALTKLAEYLATNPGAEIEISGTTARWGNAAYDIELSAMRAEAVKTALVLAGAAPGQIIARGLGWHFPGYENDRGPHGTLLPGPAEHNRSVIITRL